MVELTELSCPNCAAPVALGDAQCAYCKIHLLASADEAGPEPPPAVTRGRSERLAAALESKKLQRLWEYAAPAWTKRREDKTLSDLETFAYEVLLATLGTALVAVRSEDLAALAETIAIVSGNLLTPKEARQVLKECQSYLDHEGQERCLAAAAQLLEEAELGKQGYELAVGVVLVRGTITQEQGEVLDVIADGLGHPQKWAREARQRISAIMA